jgi:hypothetical protein
VGLLVAVAAAEAAASLACAFDAFAALSFGFDRMTVAACALDFLCVQDRCARDALCCEADDVVELFDSLVASGVIVASPARAYLPS